MASQYVYLRLKRTVYAYLGLLIESYSFLVLKILVPRNYLGQRSQTGGVQVGWEVPSSLKICWSGSTRFFLSLFLKLVVNIKN